MLKCNDLIMKLSKNLNFLRIRLILTKNTDKTTRNEKVKKQVFTYNQKHKTLTTS